MIYGKPPERSATKARLPLDSTPNAAVFLLPVLTPSARLGVHAASTGVHGSNLGRVERVEK
ncbi:MAG TPA: hypothetical protein VIF85_11135 [Gaiellaceae bacterium]|jgi:hypothetical protein